MKKHPLRRIRTELRFGRAAWACLAAATAIACRSSEPTVNATGDVAALPKPKPAAAPEHVASSTGFGGAYSSPSIVREGATLHAYFAAQTINGHRYNIPHAALSADGKWSFVGEALPRLGVHAAQGADHDPVWAPGAAQIDGAHWILYYSAREEGTGTKKCIWRAHASGPDGPFVDDYAGPIECEPSTLWAIDPYPVKDAKGRWHLAARIDQPGKINTIQLRELNAEASDYAVGSSWVKLTENSPSSWEHPVMENAGIVRLAPPAGEPHWLVFYSGRAWSDDSYAIGYADCGPRIDGPCVKKTPNGPWLASEPAAGVFGPGTPTFYPSATGDTLMSVQAWEHSGGVDNPLNHGQIMRTYTITIDDAYRPTATLVRVDK